MRNSDKMYLKDIVVQRTIICIFICVLFSQTVLSLQPVSEKYMYGDDVYNYRHSPMAWTQDGTKLAFVSKEKLVVTHTGKKGGQHDIAIPEDIQRINTIQWDCSGNLLAFSGSTPNNSINEVYIWDSKVDRVTLVGKAVVNIRRGGYRDRHSPVFWLPNHQKLVYINRDTHRPMMVNDGWQVLSNFGPRWESSEGSLEVDTDSLKIYRSFAYTQKLHKYENNHTNRSFDTIISYINLYDPNKETSQVLLKIKELNTGPNLSLGLTEVVPFPKGNRIFVAYRPRMIEERTLETRSGFTLDISMDKLPSEQLPNNVLDLTNGLVLFSTTELWAQNLPFGHNNTGAWVPSPQGDRLAWVVHGNPKNLETDLRETVHTLYVKKEDMEKPQAIRIEYPSDLKISALDYPSTIFKPVIEWASNGKELYATVAGLLWRVDSDTGEKQLISKTVDRVFKKLLLVSDAGLLAHTFDPKAGKSGFYWWDIESKEWSMVREEANAHGSFKLAENTREIVLALSRESLTVPSNLNIWFISKDRAKVSWEIQLTQSVSTLKDVEHKVFNYCNKGPQPGIGIILRGKGQKRKLPLIVKSYPADPVSNNIMHHGMADWTVDIKKAIDRGYAVMFMDTPILPGYGKVGPAQDILWGIKASVEAAGKTGWIDKGRMGIIGHSNGGYLVNIVVAHLNIFKAAVSISGISNLGSYAMNSEAGHNMVKSANRMELGLAQAPQRYVLNSPLAADLSKVDTPLLLIHGERDGTVPVSQAHEMFQALANRGKIVQFNSYKYGGHGGSGNFLYNAFQQALDWFDFYLKK